MQRGHVALEPVHVGQQIQLSQGGTLHIPQVEQGKREISSSSGQPHLLNGSPLPFLADLQLEAAGVQRHQVVTGKDARRPEAVHYPAGGAWQ